MRESRPLRLIVPVPPTGERAAVEEIALTHRFDVPIAEIDVRILAPPTDSALSHSFFFGSARDRAVL
jgi:hypothetical protein